MEYPMSWDHRSAKVSGRRSERESARTSVLASRPARALGFLREQVSGSRPALASEKDRAPAAVPETAPDWAWEPGTASELATEMASEPASGSVQETVWETARALGSATA
jgi:hypothetical protein